MGLCGLVLTVDLGARSDSGTCSCSPRPSTHAQDVLADVERAWALLLFSGAPSSFAATLAERGRPDWAILRTVAPAAPFGRWSPPRAILGLYWRYTGVLISVTKAIWADTTLLGLTF